MLNSVARQLRVSLRDGFRTRGNSSQTGGTEIVQQNAGMAERVHRLHNHAATVSRLTPLGGLFMRARLSSIFSLLLLVGLLSPTPARAEVIIQFGTGLAGSGGTLTYGGTGGALTGTNILLGGIRG